MKFAILIFAIFSSISASSIAREVDDEQRKELEQIRAQYGDGTLNYYKYKPDKKAQKQETIITQTDDEDCVTSTTTQKVGPIISKSQDIDVKTDVQEDRKWETVGSCPKCKCISSTKKHKKPGKVKTNKTPRKKKLIKKSTNVSPKTTQSPNAKTVTKIIRKHKTTTKTINNVIVKKYYIYRDTHTKCVKRTPQGECCQDDACDSSVESETEKEVVIRCE